MASKSAGATTRYDRRALQSRLTAAARSRACGGNPDDMELVRIFIHSVRLFAWHRSSPAFTVLTPPPPRSMSSLLASLMSNKLNRYIGADAMRASFQPLEILRPRTLGRYFVPVSSRGATRHCRESAALRHLNGSDAHGLVGGTPRPATWIVTASSSYQKTPQTQKCAEAWVRPSALGKKRGVGGPMPTGGRTNAQRGRTDAYRPRQRPGTGLRNLGCKATKPLRAQQISMAPAVACHRPCHRIARIFPVCSRSATEADRTDRIVRGDAEGPSAAHLPCRPKARTLLPS
jgi:hypothetical protein